MRRIALVIALSFVTPALGAEPPPLALERASLLEGKSYVRYETYWGGLHVGEFVIAHEVEAERYRLRFTLRTRGLADWMVRANLDAVSKGRIVPVENNGAPGEFRAESYRVDFVTKSRDGWTTVAYDPAGQAPAEPVYFVGRDDDPPDPEDRPPPVTADLRVGVIDPIAANIDALRRIPRHLLGGPEDFRIQVYDGVRRSELIGQHMGKARKTILGRTYDLQWVRLNSRRIAGYRKKQNPLFDFSGFDIYLTTDGRFVPVQIVSTGAGPTANLIEVCESAEACRFKDKN